MRRASLDTLDLDPDTLRITKACLRAAVEGPFFPDWEFQTLVGVDRDTVGIVMEAWPVRTVEPERFVCAVMNSLTMLLLYPHGDQEARDHHVSVEVDEVRQALERLQAAGL